MQSSVVRGSTTEASSAAACWLLYVQHVVVASGTLCRSSFARKCVRGLPY